MSEKDHPGYGRREQVIGATVGAVYEAGATYEEVDHPAHYKQGGIEAIDVIEAWDLNFSLGSVLKYIARHGRKPGQTAVVDLEKAAWYCQREADRLRKAAK